jgi:hypothetical protein
VVFGDRCGAPVDSLLPADRFPVVAASVRAVVVIGAEVPVDALLSGTPVLAIAEQPPLSMPGTRWIGLADLPSALASAKAIEIPTKDDDWLAIQLDASLESLG